MHNYHGAIGYFPPGFQTPTVSLSAFPDCFNAAWSWCSLLLPYLEQNNIANLIHDSDWPRFGGSGTTDFTGVQTCFPANVPGQLSATPLKIFRCPSDTGPDINPQRNGHAMSNYRGVAGPYTYPYISVNMDFGGVFWQNSNIRVTDITDGTSNTLGVGECMYDTVSGKTACIWAGMSGWVAPNASSGSVHISDCMWYVDNATAQINGGSIRFFRSTTDPNVVRYLAGRNDGVVVNPDF
jgi:hypothetical protein